MYSFDRKTQQPTADSGIRIDAPRLIPEEVIHLSSLILPFLILVSALLLILLPGARSGALSLLNMLFEKSEAVNSYLYMRFPPSANSQPNLAVFLLLFIAISFFLLGCLRFPVLLLILAILAASFQIYFGLSLPAWGNILLFSAFALSLLRLHSFRHFLVFALIILVSSLFISLLLPGVNENIERISEQVRDQLAVMLPSGSGQTEFSTAEDAAATRHINAETQLSGENESQARISYRLLMLEKQDISKPHWVDTLRIFLLLLLTVAIIVLPFIPFFFLSRRQRQAVAARSRFQDADLQVALQAIFRHIASYLEASGLGCRNVPYLLWSHRLDMPGDYRMAFEKNASLFEAARYGSVSLSESDRLSMLDLLDQTEQLLYDDAAWHRRIWLKYGKCLHE